MAKKVRRQGQIIERGDNKHLVRVYLGTDETTGKRRYHNHTVRGTKKDAQRYMNGVLRELDLGTFVEPAGETLNAYLDHWLEAAAKPRLRERTYDDYVALLRRYVREPLGGKKLSHLRPLDIQKLYSAMQERGLSPRIVRYTHAVLSSSLKQAVRWGMLTRNPATLVQLPKQTRTEMRALSGEEAAQFLKALAESRHAVLFKFALATGMRPEEYLALQWKDIDLVQGTATVQRALVWKKGGGWRFDEPKTARSRRTVPLPQTLARDLREHRLRQNEERLQLGSEWEANDLVFCTATGTPLNPQNLTARQGCRSQSGFTTCAIPVRPCSCWQARIRRWSASGSDTRASL
jgi:integrase